MMASPLRLGIVGVGKIARDQHLPAIATSEDFVLAAAASKHGKVDGVANFDDIDTMLADGPPLDAVAICTPPLRRDELARSAIRAGKHVMIEKPPGATVAEVAALVDEADSAGTTLFAAWHSREAAGVDAAREWLVGREVRDVKITWREDIRRWHPDQEWILGVGGFGVFDPAINALSIATSILPVAIVVDEGEMHVPINRVSPIAARFSLRGDRGLTGLLDLDFLQTGPQTWDIAVTCEDGSLRLSDGGGTLSIDGVAQPLAEDRGEYPRLYARFADLIRAGATDVDVRPLHLVADAYLVGRRLAAPAFSF